MDVSSTNIFWAVLFILSLLLIYYIRFYRSKKIVGVYSPSIKQDPVQPKPVDFDKLSEGEKLQYIVDTYFTPPAEDEIKTSTKTAEAAKKAEDNKFVASLPKDDKTCSNSYTQCSAWADEGECEINPEFMLYACPQSCKACSLNEEQKNKLVQIYNSREPAHCVYHGENYPGVFPYLNLLYDYSRASKI